MARYIDADKLLEELQEEIEFESSMYTEEQNKWFNIGLKCAVRDVKHQPTADVVEVVRCCECKSAFHDDETDLYWCSKMNGKSVKKDHFCSYGERSDT